MSTSNNFQGFDYHYWATPTSSGDFQPQLEISKYFENRKETLKKLFEFEETCASEFSACEIARRSALEIINGVHPTMTISDIDRP